MFLPVGDSASAIDDNGSSDNCQIVATWVCEMSTPHSDIGHRVEHPGEPADWGIIHYSSGHSVRIKYLFIYLFFTYLYTVASWNFWNFWFYSLSFRMSKD